MELKFVGFAKHVFGGYLFIFSKLYCHGDAWFASLKMSRSLLNEENIKIKVKKVLALHLTWNCNKEGVHKLLRCISRFTCCKANVISNVLKWFSTYCEKLWLGQNMCQREISYDFMECLASDAETSLTNELLKIKYSCFLNLYRSTSSGSSF